MLETGVEYVGNDKRMLIKFSGRGGSKGWSLCADRDKPFNQ